MKPTLTTTACLFAASVVCASISNDDLAESHFDENPSAQAATLEASINPIGDFSPSMYGIVGAAAMALLISHRRQKA